VAASSVVGVGEATEGWLAAGATMGVSNGPEAQAERRKMRMRRGENQGVW